MSSISTNIVKSISSVLNTPSIKQSIKDYSGVATAIFGALELHHFITSEKKSAPMEASARLSLVLSAATTPAVVSVCAAVVNKFVSNQYLVYTFGPNTIFAVNPWHPRHVVSFVAVACALPTVIKAIYNVASGALNIFVPKSIEQRQQEIGERASEVSGDILNSKFLDANKVKAMVIFNFVTSRPVLHLGNQLARSILNRG